MMWSKEQENYLKKVYANTDITWDEMMKKLQISRKAICHKASRLGLRRGRASNRAKKPRKQWDLDYYVKNKIRIKSNRKIRIKKLKNDLLSLFDGTCRRCGIVGPTCIYDFHHNNGEKDENISVLISNEQRKVAFEEVKKCELLCANCHRIVHLVGDTD